MTFDKDDYPITGVPVPVGTVVPVGKPCPGCGGQLAAKHVVRKLQDLVWPSGTVSGRGETQHILVEFCPNCDAEPANGIDVDPEGWKKRMVGQD